jgi:hypothetical protein
MPTKWDGRRFDVVLRFNRTSPEAPWSFRSSIESRRACRGKKLVSREECVRKTEGVEQETIQESVRLEGVGVDGSGTASRKGRQGVDPGIREREALNAGTVTENGTSERSIVLFFTRIFQSLWQRLLPSRDGWGQGLWNVALAFFLLAF